MGPKRHRGLIAGVVAAALGCHEAQKHRKGWVTSQVPAQRWQCMKLVLSLQQPGAQSIFLLTKAGTLLRG